MKRTLSTLAAAALALSLAACGSDDEGMTVSEGKLMVCSDVPYAPFEDFDESSDLGFTGFDVDIVAAIAEGLDLDLEIKDSSFDALKSGQALNAKQCDLAASAMTIDEDRAKNLDFSDGYYDSMQSLMVPEGSDVKTLADLKGKKVGVQQGTTGKTFAEENAEGADIVTFPSDAELFQAIKANQVAAVLQDLPVNVEHARKGGYEVVQEFPTDEQYGLAMRKGNTELVDKVNEQLKELRDSGEYQEIYDKYFSVD